MVAAAAAAEGAKQNREEVQDDGMQRRHRQRSASLSPPAFATGKTSHPHHSSRKSMTGTAGTGKWVEIKSMQTAEPRAPLRPSESAASRANWCAWPWGRGWWRGVGRHGRRTGGGDRHAWGPAGQGRAGGLRATTINQSQRRVISQADNRGGAVAPRPANAAMLPRRHSREAPRTRRKADTIKKSAREPSSPPGE